jgi:Amidase
LITVNQNAATEAKRLDEESKDNQSKGPLYGVPVILKDNMNTADIRTTRRRRRVIERGDVAPEVARFGIIGPFRWDASTKSTGMRDYNVRLVKSAGPRDFLLKVDG